jgi:calcineurin-like phosphoesterase family protein
MIDWYNKERGAWMIHGHQHQAPETPSCSVAHWDVGVDKNGWFPINFEQLKINITKQFLKNENSSNK